MFYLDEYFLDFQVSSINNVFVGEVRIKDYGDKANQVKYRDLFHIMSSNILYSYLGLSREVQC